MLGPAQPVGLTMMILSPVGTGLGHLIAGNPQRATLVSLGSVGATVGGYLLGDAVGSAFGNRSYGGTLGAIYGLAIYTLWAGYDAWMTAAKAEQE